ncbi:MAG TPA: DUF4124 domain-containing protein [Xanthomonadales bacterium]|nr:DUF4124 domain-containing protein [Xanthomonadales bacterium]
MGIRTFVVAVALLSACAAQAGEKFYKWKDETGSWHYTRTPPPAGAQSENVEVHGAGPSAGAAAAPASSSPDAAGTGGTPATTANGEPASPGNLSVAANADRAAQCEKARAYAKTMSENAYVATDADKDGVPELMSDAQKQRETERAQMAVKLACE